MLPVLGVRRRFARDEEGAATIEAVLWLSVMFYVIAMAVDVTMVFHGYSRGIHVVEDVNLGLSVGRIKTIDEGKSKIAANLSNYENVKSTITFVDGVVITNVSVPVTSLVVIGAVKPMLDRNIAATSTTSRSTTTDSQPDRINRNAARAGYWPGRARFAGRLFRGRRVFVVKPLGLCPRSTQECWKTPGCPM